MSIEKAIERIEKRLSKCKDTNYSTLRRGIHQGISGCLEILKEEASRPCERCKELEKRIKDLMPGENEKYWKAR